MIPAQQLGNRRTSIMTMTRKFINMVSKYVKQFMKIGSWEQKPNAIMSPGAATSLDLLLAGKKSGSRNHPKVLSIYRQRQRLGRRIDPTDSNGHPRKGLGRRVDPPCETRGAVLSRAALGSRWTEWEWRLPPRALLFPQRSWAKQPPGILTATNGPWGRDAGPGRAPAG